MIVAAAALTGIGAGVYIKAYFTLASSALTLLLFFLIARNARNVDSIFKLAAILLIVANAYTGGIDIARGYARSTKYPYTIQAEKEFKAKLVGSGERGLLVYDESGNLF